MTGMLKPFELAWRGVNRFRRSLFRVGILRARALPRPVISVGNIAVGGSGKTPVTVAIAMELLAAGKSVAILSRGYGRSSKDPMLIVDSDDPARFGDEPVVLRQLAPGAEVIVGADRWSTAMAFLRDHDCDVFVLDDGFQHLQLERDLDVVIDQSSARWLRESPLALEFADVILERSEGVGRREFRLSMVPAEVRIGDETRSIEQLRGLPIFAFSGLARNDQFFESLFRLGLAVCGTRSFPDHHPYGRSDVEGIRRAAASAGATLILTTRKDFVKIGDSDLAVLDVEARIEPRRAFLDRIFSVFE